MPTCRLVGMPEARRRPELLVNTARWLVKLGRLALPGTVFLALDLVYEQTLLTWSNGEMVGFAVSHFIGPLLLLSVVMPYAFLLGVCLLVLLRWLQHRQLPPIPRALMLTLSMSLCVTYVPYRVWKHTTITLKGPGPKAAQSPVYAAHDGDRHTVELLLIHAVPVDIDNRGSTALNGACAGGQVEIARFLLSRGADIGRAPECKDIPLGKDSPAK